MAFSFFCFSRFLHSKWSHFFGLWSLILSRLHTLYTFISKASYFSYIQSYFQKCVLVVFFFLCYCVYTCFMELWNHRNIQLEGMPKDALSFWIPSPTMIIFCLKKTVSEIHCTASLGILFQCLITTFLVRKICLNVQAKSSLMQIKPIYFCSTPTWHHEKLISILCIKKPLYIGKWLSCPSSCFLHSRLNTHGYIILPSTAFLIILVCLLVSLPNLLTSSSTCAHKRAQELQLRLYDS